MNIEEIKKTASEEIDRAVDLINLNNVYKKYLGKKGEIAGFFGSLKDLPEKDKKKTGETINNLKKFLQDKIKIKEQELKNNSSQSKESSFDITIPGKKTETGHLHPLTLVRRRAEDIFREMGFSIAQGPEIEDEWHNFDALNIPKNHPARDMWDTFWLKNGKLLRTHTSPVQIRYMKKNNPPIRIIVPGRIFRHEATDASHEINFYQLEGLMVDKDISISNFKAIIQEFFSRFFNKVIEARLRPSFFPFTEPSFEVDMSCVVCEGTGCSVCSSTGWIEIMGAGMVHPNVLKAGGLIPHQKPNDTGWQGFAFGIGLDRLTMMKYKIDDIRWLYSGDNRFLEQF